MNILFLHGWHSAPGGVKPTYLKDHGHEVLNPALPDDDFDAAVRIAQAEFDRAKPDVVVGSSRGGAVAMNIDSGSTPLVLLCPAWKRWGTARTVKLGTVILHSRADNVVPFSDSVELVRNSGLPSGSLVEIGTEHRLADPESLAKMLEAWRSAGPWDPGHTWGTWESLSVWHQHPPGHHGHVCRIVRHIAGIRSTTIGVCRVGSALYRRGSRAEVSLQGAATTEGINGFWGLFLRSCIRILLASIWC